MPGIVLSIIIPTHCRPVLLARAVRSALAGSNASVEILVVADRDASVGQTLAEWAGEPRLRLLHNNGPSGAAATRNCGVSAAHGDVVLFLDDDNELIADYPDRVLAIAESKYITWGFAGQLVRGANDLPLKLKPRQGWAGGFPSTSVPFRRKMAGLGSGFWIRRNLLVDLGGLCVEQTLDEDTDLCCRLLATGRQPWFESKPAMIIDRSNTTQRLTNATDVKIRAACYLRTFYRNYPALLSEPGAISYLSFRAHRMLLRSEEYDLLPKFYKEVPRIGLRVALRSKHLLWTCRAFVPPPVLV